MNSMEQSASCEAKNSSASQPAIIFWNLPSGLYPSSLWWENHDFPSCERFSILPLLPPILLHKELHHRLHNPLPHPISSQINAMPDKSLCIWFYFTLLFTPRLTRFRFSHQIAARFPLPKLCCNRITKYARQNHLISTPTNAHTWHLFTLKHLKSLQHVSIIRSSSGSYTVPC